MTEKKQVPAERVIDVIAYAASPKDKEGSILKDDAGKNLKGAILGKDTTHQYSTDHKGYAAAVKRDGLETVMENHNRQKKTDCRNTIASDYRDQNNPDKRIKRSIAATQKRLDDEKRAELNSKLAAILNEYEILDNE